MLFGPKYSPTPTATEPRSSSTTSNTGVVEVSGQEQSARKRGIRYRAFGKRFTLSGSNPARRDPSFQNRTYDAGLGIYDYRNRSFDPSTGRFLQRDPVLGGDSLYNPYVFPGNNPVGNVDPMGDRLLIAESMKSFVGRFYNVGALTPYTTFAMKVEGGKVAMVGYQGNVAAPTWSANAKTKFKQEVIWRMIRSTNNYQFTSQADLEYVLEARWQAVKAFKDLRAEFGVSKPKSLAAQRRWHKLDTPFFYRGYEKPTTTLKARVSMSKALKHIWEVDDPETHYSLVCAHGATISLLRGMAVAAERSDEADPEPTAEGSDAPTEYVKKFNKSAKYAYSFAGVHKGKQKVFKKRVRASSTDDWIPGDVGAIENKYTVKKLANASEWVMYLGGSEKTGPTFASDPRASFRGFGLEMPVPGPVGGITSVGTLSTIRDFMKRTFEPTTRQDDKKAVVNFVRFGPEVPSKWKDDR